ncbi:MAG: ATP-binding cassette domain-containing protein [Sedimentisphaerales bacterium]|nr:ATP-binding cassette domain-containing protein [Sedimentisphaerales bacterium]
MTTYNITRNYNIAVPCSNRTRAIASMFGIAQPVIARKSVVADLPLSIVPGGITHIIGPSGSGKTTILQSLKKKLTDDKVSFADINHQHFDHNIPLIDCLDKLSLEAAIKLLSNFGLAETSLMIDSYRHLSTGQQYRFRLASAFSLKPAVIIADEFCSCLDEITASIIACNIRHMVNKLQICFVAAGVSSTLNDFLLPDTIINKSPGLAYSIE